MNHGPIQLPPLDLPPRFPKTSGAWFTRPLRMKLTGHAEDPDVAFNRTEETTAVGFSAWSEVKVNVEESDVGRRCNLCCFNC